MTDNSDNSGWVTASGTTADTASNLTDISSNNTPSAVMGIRNNLKLTGNGPVTTIAPANTRQVERLNWQTVFLPL
ncbi:hypothetical protein [Roseovarius nanhaiticus]|uniref:hypothetical protein n=1 Tax=Roseovarius nanhaiticus TaxID=573024 RepID=UPI002490D123|nr:hypothetical protein [Roseovarius nanhaiticus]